MFIKLVQHLKQQGLQSLAEMQAYTISQDPNLQVQVAARMQAYRDNSYRIGLWISDANYAALEAKPRITYFNLRAHRVTNHLRQLQQQFFIVDQSSIFNSRPSVILHWLNEFDYFVTDDAQLLELINSLSPQCQTLFIDDIAIINQLDPNTRTLANYVTPIYQYSCYEISQCKHGLFFYNRNDIYIGDSLRRYGEYSEHEVALFKKLIKPGDAVIEVGSNIGTHTIPLGRIVGVNGIVYAFEPQKPVFDILTTNATLNALPQIKTIYHAVGANITTLNLDPYPMYEPCNFGSFEIARHGNGKTPVMQTTLDEYGIPKCNFLKIDAEGMEFEVLSGAKALIQRDKPTIYMEIDRKEAKENSLSLLTEMGYEFRAHTPQLFNEHNFKNNSQNVYGQTISRNVLCTPKP